MSRSWKTTVLGSLAVAGVLSMAGATYGAEGPPEPSGPAGPSGGGLWAAATIEPGREGIVEVRGYEGESLGAGSTLTLTAPSWTTVTGMPAAALGYRGAVEQGGATGTYTFTGASPEAWKSRTFPFVLTVRPDAEPGTRLPDCALVLRDAQGTVRDKGACRVTVGMPAPTLFRPASGVPLDTLPRTAGTAWPGAQVTVRDAAENEVCSATTAPNGIWTCVPAVALTTGSGRLQATATLNGVSATSEQIHITVAGAPDARSDADQ